MRRFGPARMLVAGWVTITLALVGLSRLDEHSAYAPTCWPVRAARARRRAWRSCR